MRPTATATTPAAPSRLLLWTLGLLSAFGPLAVDMYLPGLPQLTRDLHASASAGQLTLTASVLGIAIGQLIAGPISDARGRRLPLFSGLAVFAGTSILCALSPSIWPLIAARLLQGIGGGTGIVVARAIVRDLHGGLVAARIYATLQMITGVTPIVAPLLGGQILAISSWRGVFFTLAAIGAALWLLAAWAIPETLPPPARHTGGSRAAFRTVAELLKDKRFAAPTAAYALSFGVLFAYISGASYVLENIYHVSEQLFSVVFAINSLGIVAGSLVSNRIVGRVTPERLFEIGLYGAGIGAAGTFAICLAHANVWLLLIGFLVSATAQGLVLPNGMTVAMSTRPDALGAASGLIGLAQFGLGAAVAPLVGLGGAHDALPMGVTMLVCGVLGLTVNALFTRRPARWPDA